MIRFIENAARTLRKTIPKSAVLTRNIEFIGEIDEQKMQKLMEIADKCRVQRTLKEISS